MIDETSREIWVGKNRIYLGGDNIIYITNVGEIDEKMAISIIEAVVKLTNQVEGTVHTLTDLKKAGKTSPRARKVFQELTDQEGTQGKIAFFGVHPVARVIGTFFMGISKKKDMRFFKSKEEALAWINEVA